MNEIIMLCRKPHGCCASIEKTEEGFIIRDDYGGSVKLTKDELYKLKRMKIL